MLRAAATIILLCLLALQVNGLIKTTAKCLAGYDWTFSSIGQSPCDVAAELASVCVPGKPSYNWDPLPVGGVYSGPSLANQTSCLCNSVTYSLLSACAYCQGRNFTRWSIYYTNCTVIFLTIYTQQIPADVKVPAYAYQDVSISNTFNVTLAQSTKGVESSRSPPSSTPIPTTVSSSVSGGTVVNNTPSIVGGVIGGLVSLGLIAALITFIVLRSKPRPTPLTYNSYPRKRHNMAFVPDIPASRFRSRMSQPPGSPGRVSRATNNTRTPYPSADSMKSPNRQRSPPLKRDLTPDPTEKPAQNDVIPDSERSHDTGKSES